MLKFAWRWAEVGASVLCHDRNHLERGLTRGVIASVKRDNDGTRVGIQIIDHGETRWLWPTPLFLHPDPLDPEEHCWICDEYGTGVTVQAETLS